MKQLRYLKKYDLYKITKTRQPNGAIVETYSLDKSGTCQLQELVDEVSASIYGANLNKTYRLSTPRNVLETYLGTLMTPSLDNISEYVLVISSMKYKIVSVKWHWVDVELVGTYA